MAIQTRIDASTRTVLQAIHDLQFIGRPRPIPENIDWTGVEDGRKEAIIECFRRERRRFDPVPMLAIVGDLRGVVDNNIDGELRILETLGFVECLDDDRLQFGSFVRPDGQLVALEDRIVSTDNPDFCATYYRVSVGGRLVREVKADRRVDWRSPAGFDGFTVQAYRLTASGLNILKDEPAGDVAAANEPDGAEPAYGTKKYRVLNSLYQDGAFTKGDIVTAEHIAKTLKLPEVKREVAALAKDGFVHTRSSRGGGVWLTEQGRAFMQRSSSAP